MGVAAISPLVQSVKIGTRRRTPKYPPQYAHQSHSCRGKVAWIWRGISQKVDAEATGWCQRAQQWLCTNQIREKETNPSSSHRWLWGRRPWQVEWVERRRGRQNGNWSVKERMLPLQSVARSPLLFRPPKRPRPWTDEEKKTNKTSRLRIFAYATSAGSQ